MSDQRVERNPFVAGGVVLERSQGSVSGHGNSCYANCLVMAYFAAPLRGYKNEEVEGWLSANLPPIAQLFDLGGQLQYKTTGDQDNVLDIDDV
jgi:hypothetical protein